MMRLRSLITLMCCSVLSQSVAATEFYVDPVVGAMSNDGSRARPWRSIQAVFEHGMVASQRWAQLPYREGATLVARNEGAPVQPGDTIYLRSGYHGQLVIQGYYNSDWITIAADPGHTPKLGRLQVQAGARWKFQGLHISPEFASSSKQETLVDLESHSFRGPVHHITVEGCLVRTARDSSDWTADDWNRLACNGVNVDGWNMTIRDCTLRNVNFGISVSATDSLIERNMVENFAGDGLRGLGDNTTFQYNTVKNCYDVNGNHDDGFQSWSRGEDGRVGGGEVRGIVLRGNTIINYEDPEQPHRGTLQGIGCFDGMYVGWLVENNVIITDHYHGITLGGARDCRIVNNTVMDGREGRPGPPWIRVDKHKNGTPSTGCLVRNNLTPSLHVGVGVQADHNLIIEDPRALFVDAAAHNLRLRGGCPAIDAGSHESAPTRDAAGTARPQGDGVDIGAYEFAELRISDSFRRLAAPETGRLAIQLTSGNGSAYPLYFFIPSITRDGKYLVYHWAADREVQLYRLNLSTGQSRQLTYADCQDTQWRPWCVDSGRGVLDHRGVLNVARNLVIYFDGNDVRCVDVETLEDRRLFRIPEDREAYGQNCTTPDGQWLVYIHTPRGSIWGEPCQGAAVAAYHFDTQEQRELCRIDSAIFHVTAYDNRHFVVTHPADHAGMLWTDLSSGRITPLRDGDPGVRGHLVHCHVTERGIAYEVPEVQLSGLYDPFHRSRFEFPFPHYMQYVHTGRDPAGRLWFYENSTGWDKFDTHDMHALVRLDPERGQHEWIQLTGTWPTYVGGQKAHFHPQLTPDRRWILFTGGDPATETTQIFLLDVSDLRDTQGITRELLSPTGANDLTKR